MKTSYGKKIPLAPLLSRVFPDKGVINKPFIKIVLKNQDQKVAVWSLVDSGADACIFPKGIAEVLNIDIDSGQKTIFSGIGSNDLSFYFHEVELLFDQYRIKTKVGFSNSKNIGASGIIGQLGFFEKFKVAFDYKNDSIEIIES